MTADDPLAAALAAAGLAGVRPGTSRAAPRPRPSPPGRGATGPARPLARRRGHRRRLHARHRPARGRGRRGGRAARAAPRLPELPARGVGADMIGRTAGLLVDIAVEVRAVGLPGHREAGPRPAPRRRPPARRPRRLRRGHRRRSAPPWVKVQAAGPWTLAASVELHTGHKVLTDRGAVREFAAQPRRGAPRARRRGGGRAPGPPCCSSSTSRRCPPC